MEIIIYFYLNIRIRLLYIAEESNAPHGPVSGPSVTLEVNRTDVVQVSPRWLPVDWTLIQSE